MCVDVLKTLKQGAKTLLNTCLNSVELNIAATFRSV